MLPNEALSKGDIDLNAFQHKPYPTSRSKIAATSWCRSATPLFTRSPVTPRKSNRWTS
ncbi:MetQ/NlpA family ABC transporter substrate-binding protein [Serratia ureilytica]